jgi:dihydroorotase
MVAREIALCRLTRTPIHIAHLSTAVAIEHVRRAKEDGLPITAEASPHHLTLTEEAVRELDTNTKMAPPLRSEKDVEALRKAVAEGVVDILATDHAPHGAADKECEFVSAANGILGLQTAAPLTYELVVQGHIPLHRWLESWTLKPARFLKLNAGQLRVGMPADITLFNPQARWKLGAEALLSKSLNTPFLGWTLHGQATCTITGGIITHRMEKPASASRLSKKGAPH